MSIRTSKYKLGYFEEGDTTSSTLEMQRWETLDSQLYALYQIIGNGIIEGWDIIQSSGLSIVVTPGSGNVNFVAVNSKDGTTVELTSNTRNYIYAKLSDTSYWTQETRFNSFVSEDTSGNALYLGYVDTDQTDVTGINTDGRTFIGFVGLIRSLISEHRHIGGVGNPPPVDLNSEVTGILGQRNLPDLDASIIQTGTLDQDRLPQLDHITQLINQGTLTHAQLDSFVEALSIENSTLMGETSTVDLLQLILALKHVYPNIDEYLINELAYIPGISPDSYVDWENTTATVDTRTYAEGGEHTITGVSVSGKNAYTHSWDSETEFKSGTNSNVLIDGGSVCLEAQENTLAIDSFSDISQWDVVTNDLSSLSITLSNDTSTYVDPPSSARLVVGNQSVEIALVIQRQFDAQDWSGYDKITFFLKTESVSHGDVFFFLNDNTRGTQGSHTKVINRNTQTINVDTLKNGWQEVTIDISSYSRSEINTIGFYISSQEGWDTSKGFDLNLDDIYLTTGNTYKEDGYIRLRYGSDFPYDFWRVRWDASLPSDTQSTGIALQYRTRVANNEQGLDIAGWSSYSSVSGSDISLPTSNLYKYIEIEVYFGASDDLTRSACLRRLYLDYYSADVENQFTYENQDEWDSGELFSIDSTTSPGTIRISETGDINDTFFGSYGEAVQVDDTLVELYKITGTSIPRSTSQVINGAHPSFGLITGVSRGNNGNIWVTDTDYDKVVELNKYGQLVRGFYGSWIDVPIDNYGTEDEGPGSNVIIEDAVTTTTTTSTLALGATLDVIHSIYNPNNGTLYVAFSEDIENIYQGGNGLNMDRLYLKVGAHKFYLNDSIVTLLGVDEEAYNIWYDIYQTSTTSNSVSDDVRFLTQFKFTSHVLKIELQGADRSLLNYMVNQLAPTIIIGSPNEQKMFTKSTATIEFLLYNFTLGISGDSNRIRVTLDDGTPQDIYDDNITFNNLSLGTHSIKAQLVNDDGTLNTNIEAIAEGTFSVQSSQYSDPYISILTPKPNQVYSSSPIVVEFEVDNFPVLPTGQHIRYAVDGWAPVDYYLTDPIAIDGLEYGSHTVTLTLVDSRGNSFGYSYGSATAEFIVGLNSNARVRLYVDPEAIYNLDKSITTATIRKDVDVSNVYFQNIYSPIDIQVIPCDTSSVNPDGRPTVLVSKLRSRSWTNGLGDADRAAEFSDRIKEEATSLADQADTTSSEATTTTTTTELPLIPTSDLVYGTKYLNGHSVVQMNMESDVIMSNNAAIFASNKENAKDILGSAEKVGDQEILIGDSINKRAIITLTDLETETPRVEWQYDSDRYVPDFHIVRQDEIVVSVRDDAIDPTDLFIRQNSIVVWENNSVSPISIYSGTTTYSQFQADPDLNLYGDIFKSPVLEPGERFSHKFVSVGEVNWFVYPGILTGKITVTRHRVSSRDKYIILESDGLDSPFSSRVIKVDSWGNVVWSFGESYLVKPRDARPLLNNGVIIST